jgi:para-nitrobenzyl esterase
MPRHWYSLIICCLVFIASAAHTQTLGAAAPIVTTKTGEIEGTHFGPAQNAAAFLGIPYAAPPIGNLRWKPPQPVAKWNGKREAAKYGAPCPQLPARWFTYIGWNEDCLFLNVWTPELSNNSNLPVIVYFHGGSNTQGYSQMTPLGPPLSQMGVVVVSANYRLGPFGFLAHPALTAESEHHSSGNYGLLDQLQALRWVHDNIAIFGGDPSRVTVMGQSAGAVDACLLMTSPLATGLFQGVIMQSGECQSSFNQDIRTPIPYNFISGTGEGVGQRLASDLGVADGPDALKKLRAIPADEILKAWGKDPQVHFDAIVDGWIVPEQPVRIFGMGKQMRVPVLVGSNADEATVFGHNDVKTVEQYKDYLRRDARKYFEQELQTYPVNSDADVPARFLQLQSDSFAYGAYSLAQAVTRAGQKAYLYYSTYAEAGKRKELGAYHGLELKFLSDSFPADWQHSPDDKHLGRTVQLYWTQFARTGNPNAAGVPLWPPYDARTAQCFELGRKIGARSVAPQIRSLEHIMNEVFGEAMVRQ